jgi:ribulose-5-phosphate 4-epimerase/fuculose-1-phosphate aldolase
MEKINKFLFRYVKNISLLSTRKTKTINSVISKNIQEEIEQSLNAIAFRDYVIRDLFEISVRQSANHFVALNKNSWNQFKDRINLDLFSIHSNWSLEEGKQSDGLVFHKRIYQNTKANAIVVCHPLVLYELVHKEIKFRNAVCLPNSKIFDKFIVLPEDQLKTLDKLTRLTFSFKKGLISWGKNLFEVINQIELLIFCAKLAIINNDAVDKIS